LASEGITVERTEWTVPKWLQGLLALVLVAAALALLGMGLARTGSPVLVEVDGRSIEMRTHASTVDEALRRGGFHLFPEDRVSPGLETELEPGTVIHIDRAQPVALSADGRTWQVRTHTTSIAGLLSEAGVRVGPADEIWFDGELVDLQTPLAGGSFSSRQVSHRGGLRNPVETTTSDPPLVALHRAADLTLDDGGTTTTLHTTANTVGQVLESHGIKLFLADEVTPGLQARITPGMTVTIRRSIPVHIKVDGKMIRTRTQAETVAGALGQEGIALVGKDTVEPALDAPIRPYLTMRVTRIHEEYVVEFEPIPFETVWVPDPEVEIDNIFVAQKGQLGLTKRRYRVLYEDGEEVGRTLEDVWAEQQPVTKTMAYGTKIVIRTLETPEGTFEYWRKMRVYAVSYTAASSGKSKDHPRYGYTRLGWKLKKGIVAVDPEVIPLRTRMYIPGYGHARAGDTGGGIKGKFVDLGFEKKNYESWHWWTDIYLLTPVPPRKKILWILPDYPRFPDRR